MWNSIILTLEKAGTISQVSLSSCVKLVLVNYQVQLDSGIKLPPVFTIAINAVVPNALKTTKKRSIGD